MEGRAGRGGMRAGDGTAFRLPRVQEPSDSSFQPEAPKVEALFSGRATAVFPLVEPDPCENGSDEFTKHRPAVRGIDVGALATHT